MENDNIQAALNENQLSFLLNLVSQIKKQMPYLIDLPMEKRKQIYRKGEEQYNYIRKAFSYAKQYPNYVPPFIDVKEMKNKMDVADRLMKLKKELKGILDSVDDTAISLYQDSFEAARILYMNYQTAARSNAPGTKAIVEDLKQHFPRTGKRKKKMGVEAEN